MVLMNGRLARGFSPFLGLAGWPAPIGERREDNCINPWLMRLGSGGRWFMGPCWGIRLSPGTIRVRRMQPRVHWTTEAYVKFRKRHRQPGGNMYAGRLHSCNISQVIAKFCFARLMIFFTCPLWGGKRWALKFHDRAPWVGTSFTHTKSNKRWHFKVNHKRFAPKASRRSKSSRVGCMGAYKKLIEELVHYLDDDVLPSRMLSAWTLEMAWIIKCIITWWGI